MATNTTNFQPPQPALLQGLHQLQQQQLQQHQLQQKQLRQQQIKQQQLYHEQQQQHRQQQQLQYQRQQQLKQQYHQQHPIQQNEYPQQSLLSNLARSRSQLNEPLSILGQKADNITSLTCNSFANETSRSNIQPKLNPFLNVDFPKSIADSGFGANTESQKEKMRTNM